MSDSIDQFDYTLPKERIAQQPAMPRDSARLLVAQRGGAAISHHRVAELPDLLPNGALLVLNNTRVEPRRLFTRKVPTGGNVELLLLDRLSATGDRWRCMVRPGIKPGQRLTLLDADQQATEVGAEVRSVDQDGLREISFSAPAQVFWDRIGHLPLPPYIKDFEGDPTIYQTIYAAQEGSVAAPTAGRHFTPELFARLEAVGIERVELTLHVARDTAFPVPRETDLEQIELHSEAVRLTEQTVERIAAAKREGRPVIAVGTTSVRTLEGVAARHPEGVLEPYEGPVNLFIRPGFSFKVIDGLMTNFHVPRSTLMMLVAAFMGRERLLECYQAALDEEYRFLSFGDAMLIT